MTEPIVVFDLDGTLIDSAPDIHAASARLLTAEGVEPLSFDTIRSFIGHGVPALIDQIIFATGLSTTDRERLISEFLDDYNANATVLTRLFPDTLNCLSQFKQMGFRIGVCTNKPLLPTLGILEALNLSEFIDDVVGGDCFPNKKPDPTGLNSLVSKLGNGPTLYIGDSVVDAQTAERAGIPFGLFTKGYLNGRPDDVHCSFKFEAFADLAQIVEELFSHQRAMA